MTSSANFSFLADHDPQLVRLGTQAERYFKEDPVTSLIKLRQYGEALAQIVAAKAGMYRDPAENQADLLRRLAFDRILPMQVADLFHILRRAGNRATHDNQATHSVALSGLKVGRELGIWFHRTFGSSPLNAVLDLRGLSQRNLVLASNQVAIPKSIFVTFGT